MYGITLAKARGARKTALTGAFAASWLLALNSTSAAAQGYPAKPVSLACRPYRTPIYRQ